MNIIDNIERGVVYSSKEITDKIQKKEDQIDILSNDIIKLKNMQNMSMVFSNKYRASKKKTKKRSKRKSKRRSKRKSKRKQKGGGVKGAGIGGAGLGTLGF